MIEKLKLHPVAVPLLFLIVSESVYINLCKSTKLTCDTITRTVKYW